MKKTALLALLTLSGVISANAAPSRANDGDVLLGFSKVGSEFNYTVNLGSRANFVTNFNAMLADIRTDLSNIYGLATPGLISFGGVSMYSEDNTLNATVAAGTIGWTPEAVGSDSLQSFAATQIGRLVSNYNRYVSNAAEGTIGLAGVKVSVSDEESWYNLHSATMSGAPFDYFGGSLEGNLAGGVTFYSLNPANGYHSDAVQGATLNSVPEPSTYVLFGLGSLLLMIAYRRRSNA